MELTNPQWWQRYKTNLCACLSIGLTLDISRMAFPDDFLGRMRPAMDRAFAAMDKLEHGAIANPDEKRMVGHYWLRYPSRAPTPEIRDEIEKTLRQIKTFAKSVHDGDLRGEGGDKFTRLLIIGIGGSALGPQFVADALGSFHNAMIPLFFDNTDPDGMDRVLASLGKDLARTLVVVISKSGGTQETRNGMLAAASAYEAAGLSFARHAVAITGAGSLLDQTAEQNAWLARFPMWDWVGGRTSELSAVGLLPAALQGIDIDAILAGARDCDEITRLYEMQKNPAALLALMWYHAGEGRGAKDMVVLPYKDRLLLFSRYLQQLVMESLGKELDRSGQRVCQGIAVYGNKGSTDQHAYVQQLRDGINNFFVTFIVVLRDRSTLATPDAKDTNIVGTPFDLEVAADTTSGDYLNGFYQGTRQALADKGRESMTITLDEFGPRAVGVLIALFERAVGLYAELIGINAYNQPGVEAGKKAAGGVIELQKKVLDYLRGGNSGTAEEIARAIGATDQTETVHHTLRHLAANPVHRVRSTGDELLEVSYRAG